MRPRTDHAVIRFSTIAVSTYIKTPISAITNSAAKASGTSKRDEATVIRWPMPELAATFSDTIEPTNAKVIAILSDAK